MAETAAAPAIAPAIKVQRNFYRAGLEDDKLVPSEDTNFGAEEEVCPRPAHLFARFGDCAQRDRSDFSANNPPTDASVISPILLPNFESLVRTENLQGEGHQAR